MLYHFPVHELAEHLLKTIRKQQLIRPGDRVAVAVSGGADSVALFLLLLDLRSELGIVLSVAHVNHKLRGEESDADERFVAELAGQHGLEMHSQDAPLNQASVLDSGIEASARKLRYEFFRRLAREACLAKIATAHTLDDQSETVLLRMLRGTGLRGLSGIHPRLMLKERGETFGEVVRPLLGFRRSELEAFLRERSQAWREDSSNRDLAFLRNRVRHRVLPLLRENFGPAAVENLADLAEIARAEEEHWATAHPEIGAHGQDSSKQGKKESLTVASLLTLPLAAQRRLIREWLGGNAPVLTVSFRLIEDVLDLARGPSGKRLELPGGHVLRRSRRDLSLEPAGAQTEPAEYEYRLSIPGQVEVPNIGVRIEAVLADRKSVPEIEHEQLLDPAHLPKELIIRNWRPGDRFWPAHTKEAKKVKELLSGRPIARVEKRLWPVAVAQGLGLVWMRRFAVPAELQPSPSASRALWLREVKTRNP
ncbi:MAG: tRNA lysidine(34) synthetase TilS [Terriglobales bacterium]